MLLRTRSYPHSLIRIIYLFSFISHFSGHVLSMIITIPSKKQIPATGVNCVIKRIISPKSINKNGDILNNVEFIF